MGVKAIGIDIFGGGFTVGVRKAGFEVLAQWEECGAGRKTWDLNAARYFQGIARPLTHREWDVMLAADLVYANPPCAPWSAANTKLGMTPELRSKDPRLAMTERAMLAGQAISPKVFVLETVARGYTLGRAYYDKWAEQWLELGYGVTYYLTDALLLGVPSTRQRFHFIAHRNEVNLPEPYMKTFMPKTCSMAIGDLVDRFGHVTHHVPKRIGRDYWEAMEKCEQGELLVNHRPRSGFLLRRMVWDAPGYTQVNVDSHLIHPLRPRFLTWREGLRLCGYPDDFVLHQSEPHAATQAVLPMVGEHLGRIALDSMDNGRAQNELEIVDHRDLAKPYRPGEVGKLLREESDDLR